MKISPFVKPSAAALAIALCSGPYVAAQDNGNGQNTANQQADAANKSTDADHATCPVCGLSVENAKDDSKGVKVVNVKSESPADKAGVKKGDVIVSVNDNDVNTSEQLHNLMSKQQKKSEQSTVKVGLQRNGADRQVTLTLKSKDEQASNEGDAKNDSKATKMENGQKSSDQRDRDQNRKNRDKKEQDNAKKHASLGVTLDPAPQQFGEGVRISSVYTNGPAQKAGLKTGDRILKVDGKDVSSVKELQDSIDGMAPDHTAKIRVMVDGEQKDLDIQMVSKAETIQRAMVGINQAVTQPANQMESEQTVSETLREIRNELRELRERVESIERDDDGRGDARNDRDSDNDGQNQ